MLGRIILFGAGIFIGFLGGCVFMMIMKDVKNEKV